MIYVLYTIHGVVGVSLVLVSLCIGVVNALMELVCFLRISEQCK